VRGLKLDDVYACCRSGARDVEIFALPDGDLVGRATTGSIIERPKYQVETVPVRRKHAAYSIDKPHQDMPLRNPSSSSETQPG